MVVRSREVCDRCGTALYNTTYGSIREDEDIVCGSCLTEDMTEDELEEHNVIENFI